jgi:hypothetical protein
MTDRIIDIGYKLSRIETEKKGETLKILFEIESKLDDFFITMSEVADWEREWHKDMRNMIKNISEEFKEIKREKYKDFKFFVNFDVLTEILKNIETIYNEIKRDVFVEFVEQQDINYIKKHLNKILDIIERIIKVLGE